MVLTEHREQREEKGDREQKTDRQTDRQRPSERESVEWRGRRRVSLAKMAGLLGE